MKNIGLPLPNVYAVSVHSALIAAPLHLYIAGDFTGSVMRKLQRYCREHLGFVPSRSNSVVKLRRYRLKDYLDYPQALIEAHTFAVEQGERDTALKLAQRPKEVAELYNLGDGPSIDHDAVWALLTASMSSLITQEVARG